MKIQGRRIRTCFVLWSILTALVSGCSFTIERLDQPPPTILPSATLPVATATATLLPATKAISTPTAQPAPELSLAPECIPIEENMPDDLVLSGVWLRNRGKPYLEDIASQRTYGVRFRGGGIFSTRRVDMAVSPDGKYLAYIDAYLDDARKGTKSRRLRVIHSSGRLLPMEYWTTDWQWLVGWVDNQHLAILTGSRELLLLQPFTGQWEKLRQPSWLDDTMYSYYGFEGPYYNPSLDRIFLQSGDMFELKDPQTGKTIYAGEGFPGFWDFDWSANGSTLVIGVENSLKIIPGDQQVIEVDAGNLGIDSVNYPSLSPDGQKLVFTSYGSGKFFLLDIESLTVRKVCSEEFKDWENTVWSPDNRFVVQEVNGSNSGPFDLLLDTQQMRAYKLVSGRYQHRLVWLAAP